MQGFLSATIGDVMYRMNKQSAESPIQKSQHYVASLTRNYIDTSESDKPERKSVNQQKQNYVPPQCPIDFRL
uniref:Uncharacterized protein n=1 Tax=Romanomermis culicivorax TaxID=13658 RepID=A0A915L154_ROMCU